MADWVGCPRCRIAVYPDGEGRCPFCRSKLPEVFV